MRQAVESAISLLGLVALWAINDDTGTGLLKLPHGWDRDRSIWTTAVAEITAAGYQVVEHDTFHVALGDDTFYLLRKAAE